MALHFSRQNGEIEMHYVQRKGNGYLETVDEFEKWSEAKKMVKEYRLADPYASYYLSQRACKDWREIDV